jgi:lambda family phage tail tape measure protein
MDWGKLFSSFIPSANGNVFPAGAGISAYSGQIVSQPTLFPFANGVGLMGEAGAEAIMPLKRGADGKLGVQASGGATTINNNFHITGAADPRTQAQIAQQAGAAAARAMRRNG